MNEFWYWWDKNVARKPFWYFMSKVYIPILGSGLLGYVIASLVRGSWTEAIFGCLMATMFLIIFANIVVTFINIEMSFKYCSKNWNKWEVNGGHFYCLNPKSKG